MNIKEEEAPTHLRVGEIAAIHGAITQLSVDVGRVKERLEALDEKLVHHTQEEHREFRETLVIVSDMSKQITTIQNAMQHSKGAWWALAKIGAILVAVLAAGSGVIAIFQKLVEVIPHTHP